MSFSNPTAPVDTAGVLSSIKTFAVADAWTADYDDIAGAGGVGAQLALSKGNCKLTIGEKNNTENPIERTDAYNGGTVDDAYLYMVVNHSITASLKQFWNHPGGTPNANIVTTAADAHAVKVNDLAGEGSDFSNIWLFSNAAETYVWVVTEQGGDRYTTFGFGVLDKKGMTHPDVGFCVGHDYRWWPDNAVINSGQWADPASTSHQIGILGEPDLDANAMLFLPDTVVDPALGFTDADYQTYELGLLLKRGNVAGDEDGISNPFHYMLNYFLITDNQSTTGGQMLSAFSALVDQNSLVTFVGEYPDIRLVNMANLTPAQSIFRGAEEWVVFPFKRKGTRDAQRGGASPKPFVNSIEYGFAIKKTV